MLGPLPYLHRVLLVIVAISVCTGIGAWLGLFPTFPIDIALGAFLGLAAGTAAAYLLVHDFHHRAAAAGSHRHVH